jgi:phage gp46-like protein
MTDILTRYAMVAGQDELQLIPPSPLPFAASLAGAAFNVAADGVDAAGDPITIDEQAALLALLRTIPGGADPRDPPRYESPDGIAPPVEVYPGGTFGLGGFSMTVNGALLDTGELDLTGLVDLPALAALLQTRLGPTVIVSWRPGALGYFTIVTVATGPRATITDATKGEAESDISDLLRLTAGAYAIVTQGANTPVWQGKEMTGTYPSCDWVFEAPDLVNDEGLETAVVLSLFTDALAAEDDVLPSLTEDDRRGWWAQPWGSKLWLLTREKWTDDVRLRAEFYTREALNWMMQDGVADDIQVEARLMDIGQVAVAVAIYKDGRLLFAKPFGLLWQATIEEAQYALR